MKQKSLRYNTVIILCLITIYCFAKDPSQLYLTYGWGHYNLARKQFSIAEHAFNNLIDSGCIHAGLHGIALSCGQKHDFKKIISLEHNILQYMPNDPDINLVLLRAYIACNMPNRAYNHIKQIIEKSDICHQELAYTMAVICIEMQQFDHALTIIKKYVSQKKDLVSQDFVFFMLETQAYVYLQQLGKAQESISKALALNSSFLQGWLLKGSIEEMQGNHTEAIKAYQEAKKFSDNKQEIDLYIKKLKTHQVTQNTLTIYQRLQKALAHYNNLQFKSALEELERCLQADPSYTPALELKINILRSSGNEKEAKLMLEGLLKNNPENFIWKQYLDKLSSKK